MCEKTMVTVATYDDPVIAHLARNRLESIGIQAFLDGEHHVAMDWFVATAVGGIKLQVEKSEHAQASQILTEPEVVSDFEGEDFSESESDQKCPDCGAAGPYRERLKRKLVFLSVLLFGVPVPFLSRKLICRACDHRWCP